MHHIPFCKLLATAGSKFVLRKNGSSYTGKKLLLGLSIKSQGKISRQIWREIFGELCVRFVIICQCSLTKKYGIKQRIILDCNLQ